MRPLFIFPKYFKFILYHDFHLIVRFWKRRTFCEVNINFETTVKSGYQIIMVFSGISEWDKHGQLKKIASIAINLITFEDIIIKQQLPVNNYTNIITNQY